MERVADARRDARRHASAQAVGQDLDQRLAGRVRRLALLVWNASDRRGEAPRPPPRSTGSRPQGSDTRAVVSGGIRARAHEEDAASPAGTDVSRGAALSPPVNFR